jgi:hypothetical protein
MFDVIEVSFVTGYCVNRTQVSVATGHHAITARHLGNYLKSIFPTLFVTKLWRSCRVTRHARVVPAALAGSIVAGQRHLLDGAGQIADDYCY